MDTDRAPTGCLVECFWPGVNRDSLADTERHLDAAAASLRQHGRDISFVGSILVAADESVFFLFDGIEADVRAVSSRAGIPLGRVLEATRSGL